MLTKWLTKRMTLAILGGMLAIGQIGCHACQSCHDYGSPVSGSSCGACGNARAGSYSSMQPQESGVHVAGEHTVVR